VERQSVTPVERSNVIDAWHANLSNTPHPGVQIVGPDGKIARYVPVRVVDVDIEFRSMVGLTVKWAFAAIPAAIILVLPILFIAGFFEGMGRH
jgi:hypothetical protein